MRKKVRNFYYHFVVNMVKISQKATLFMVQIGGLEPPQIAPYAPQAYVSTNSTIGTCGYTINGPLDWVRSSNLRYRKSALCPVELRGDKGHIAL